MLTHEQTAVEAKAGVSERPEQFLAVIEANPGTADAEMMAVRDRVLDSDLEAVRRIVSAGNFFYDYEVRVAVELVEERLARGPSSGYLFVFAEVGGRVVGYACYGPVACTRDSFDLYWIAVSQEFRGRGIGKRLLAEAEKAIAELGGRRVYIETSSRDEYGGTRAFYESCRYRAEALLRDFYGPGDSKVVYVKTLGADCGEAGRPRPQAA